MKTVGDLLGSPEIPIRNNERNRIAMTETAAGYADKPTESEGLYVVRLIMDPNDVEILDGKLIYEKRIIAHSHNQAVFKFGVDAKHQ